MADARGPHTYTLHEVECLIGMHEDQGPRAPRHLTILDIRSWAGSAGGDPLWAEIGRDAREEDLGEPDWMARTGPLDPCSEEACALWDYRAAVKYLTEREYLVVSLLIAGWSKREIANHLRVSKPTVERTLGGRPRRHPDQRIVRDEEGKPVMNPGAAQKLTKAMNGGRP